MVDAPVPSPPPQSAVQPVAVVASPPVVPAVPVDRRVQKQVRKLGVGDATRTGGGTLFTEQVLVVNQKAKLFERRAEYGVFDQHGRNLGGVRELGASMSRLAVGRENATKRLQIVDAEGRPLLMLTRPATMLKSNVTIMREDGSLVGHIIQESLGVLASLLGGKFNVRFRMEADGVTLGAINAEDWRAWDFNLQDPHGSEIARITKTWAGFGKENFTKADNYVLEMHRPLEDPLLTLVVSAALVVDTVLKQASDGSRRIR
ncbi:phospholipid scramblase-related protein [Microbacterium kribbense]|uniref:Phospholipid scramblase-related protein n=2 Tax=Microbacterium kribbense TaxID=433645 RepID=A0ABP7H3T0_9MICO